jgi:protein-S-isoprenylcysteine O-methyltransferase Ste14
MSLTKRYVEFLYRIATTRNRLKIIMTPVGIIFWFGVGVLLVFLSLWLDKFLSVTQLLPVPVNLFLSVPALIIGVALLLWCFVSFIMAKGSPVPLNPPLRMVISGPYSRLRNPMILGWIIVMLGVGLLLNSLSLAIIFAPLFLLLNVLYLKTIEEKEMEKKFGRQYLRYKESVPMFLPRLGKYRGGRKGK